jgi:ABC-type dipeptide transport system, periplasmic component
VHFLLEKETAPYWNKFLQGYYDKSGISSDNFDQAIEVKSKGQTVLAPRMSGKNIRLLTSNSTSVYYTAFNMLDKTVGGYTASTQKLRQAISIAINEEEYISIFRNGRGSAAHGPIPAGIFGAAQDYNPFVYDSLDKRKDISKAKDLMIQAGYSKGIDPVTNKPLVLYFDTTASGAEDQPRLDWIRKQFKKIGIQLVVRSSSYNRLQDKMSKGQTQLFELGWNADYPDPENFLFYCMAKIPKLKPVEKTVLIIKMLNTISCLSK